MAVLPMASRAAPRAAAGEDRLAAGAAAGPVVERVGRDAQRRDAVAAADDGGAALILGDVVDVDEGLDRPLRDAAPELLLPPATSRDL
jgi:hypothetical protein